MSALRRPALLLAAVLAGPLASALPASAAVPQGPVPSLTVAPAIVELQGRPPMALPNATVRNTTARTIRVRAYPVLVTQGLDGALVPNTQRRSLGNAAKRFRVSPSSFTLPSGAGITLTESWLGRLPSRPGSWAAIMIDAVPAVAHPRVRLRLLQALLLTLPGAPAPSTRVVAVDASRGAKSTGNLAIRVSNPSRVHAWITAATLQVRHAGGGRAITTRAPLPRVVLPGATRDVQLRSVARLKPGWYRAVAVVHMGRAVMRRTFSFEVSKLGLIAARR